VRPRFRFPRRRAACALCAVALGTLAAAAAAQTDKLPKWRIDPYTRNDPEPMAKAGYVSFGPFPFGNLGASEVRTDAIDKSLPYVQILWLETAHFRLGIDLPEFTVPMDPETRAKIRSELERLAEKLPRVNPKARRLDPWLRAHLFAQRAEDLYAEFCRLAGVRDEDFPQDPDKVIVLPGATYMGQGPFLGMKNKFLLLLFEKEGPFRQYMQAYLGRDSRFGQRWHCKDVSSLLYTVSTESDENNRLKDDTALHCNVAFNVSQNLLDGFRYYSYDLPVWIREGFGHWFERRVDPRFNSFDQTEGSPADMRTTSRWEPYVRNLIASSGKFAPFAEAYTWRDFGSITFNDHVAIWSRMDFLMAQGREKWQSFLFEVKGRVTKDWLPDQQDLVGVTRDALHKCYGISVLTIDEKWAEWVKANYPTQ
jgi:hypothetical protein